MLLRSRVLAFCLGAGAMLCGCPKKVPNGTLVVGVDAQPAITSQLGKLTLKATVGSKVLAERTLTPRPGESPFPFEVKLDAPVATQVDVTIEGFPWGPNNTVGNTPMVVRRSRIPFVAGATKLVPLRLEASCLTGLQGFKGPQCPPTQSCSSGRCIDPTLFPEDLEPYAANWATDRPDICRPAHAGDPVVIVGTGQTDFLALTAGQTLAPERGPQGGHHLWIAARMKNLRQSGTIIELTAEQPGTGLKVPPTSFVFSFERDEGGFCKLYGLRFQLDNSSVPVAKFLGQPLDVKVSLRDPTGRTAESTIRLNVAAKTLEW